MMQCQICGDTQGPWQYEEYISVNKKPWLIENGKTVLVCEECAKILQKRLKQEKKEEEKKAKIREQYEYFIGRAI